MNPLTPILLIVGLLVVAASGGPTNPGGWDPSWALPPWDRDRARGRDQPKPGLATPIPATFRPEGKTA